MNELQLQTLVVKAIKAHGGYSFKLANRFLVGVPDLLIHIGGVTGIWEVKKRTELRPGTRIKFALSPSQVYTLNTFWKVGGVCGMIDFMVGKRHIYMGVFDMNRACAPIYANEQNYTELPRGHREEYIAELLRKEHDRHKSAGGLTGRDPRRLQRNVENSPVDQEDLPLRAGME